ncbi:hypothetical protein T484DRAFT_1814851 [Baffinella frigidus]|nr:hypothetical protein T484DRAFT_1814851 [Cryptophyta sp. CCMP2293]
MGPLSQKSKIIKNNYDPVFDHTFYFDAENGIPQNGLTISLYDYNAVSKDELLAVVSITEDRLNDVIKNPSGFKTEKSTLKFLNKGVNLKGNDGKWTSR